MALGLGLSVASKLLQFRLKRAGLGNVVVVPAAVCLVLAALFSLSGFTRALGNPETRSSAIWLAVLACGATASFQMMMMAFVQRKWLAGGWGLLAFGLSAFLTVRLWFKIT